MLSLKSALLDQQGTASFSLQPDILTNHARPMCPLITTRAGSVWQLLCCAWSLFVAWQSCTPQGTLLQLSGCCWGHFYWQVGHAPTISHVCIHASAHPPQLPTTFVVFADLVSALYHFLMETFGDESTPVVGKLVSESQDHHERPWTITLDQPCKRLYQVIIVGRGSKCKAPLSSETHLLLPCSSSLQRFLSHFSG